MRTPHTNPHTHTHIRTPCTHLHTHRAEDAGLPVFFARCSTIPSLFMFIFLHISIRYWILHCIHFVHKFLVFKDEQNDGRARGCKRRERKKNTKKLQFRICAKWIFAHKTSMRLCFCSSMHTTRRFSCFRCLLLKCNFQHIPNRNAN